MESAGELCVSMRGIIRWKHGQLKMMYIFASGDYFIRSGAKWRLSAWGLHLRRQMKTAGQEGALLCTQRTRELHWR